MLLTVQKARWIELNASVVADGTSSLAETARELFCLDLDIASGKKIRSAEQGFREIAIPKDGIIL